MGTFVALLRAINLGSHNKVNMPQLRDLFEDLGYERVQTYLQSGNVVFQTSTDPTSEDVAGQIERQISAELGLDVTVLVRSLAEIEQTVSKNPFTNRGAEPTILHGTFLCELPDPKLASSDLGYSGTDEFLVSGRDVYLFCPTGYGRTKLNNAFWERKLKTQGTTRNWRTVGALLDMAREVETA